MQHVGRDTCNDGPDMVLLAYSNCLLSQGAGLEMPKGENHPPYMKKCQCLKLIILQFGEKKELKMTFTDPPSKKSKNSTLIHFV